MIVQNWKQPKSLSRRIDKEKEGHLHNEVLLMSLKNDNMKFKGKWMEAEEIIVSEVSYI